MPALAEHLSEFEVTTSDQALHLSIGDTVADLRHLLAAVDASGIPMDDYSVRTPTLDDVYFHVTGHERPAIAEPTGSETIKEDAA